MEHKVVKIPQGGSVLDATKAAFKVEYFAPGVSPGHEGVVVISIDGVKATVDRGWVYYILDEGAGKWVFRIKLAIMLSSRRTRGYAGVITPIRRRGSHLQIHPLAGKCADTPG